MRCAVLGDPIEHSLSPAMHRAGFAAVGLDWEYDAIRVPAGGLSDFVAALDLAVWRGLSVTAPLKREAWALGRSRTVRAQLSGAANTLRLDDVESMPGGEDVVPPVHADADNTDVPGLVDALAERGLRPEAITILGGGATAASAVVAAAELGLASVQVLVRDPARLGPTRQVADRCGVTLDVAALDTRVAGDLVVSTIPAAAETPSLVEACLRASAVFEVVYDPWPTPLAAAARSAGLPVLDGLDLLAHQGVHQFEWFTGHDVDVDVFREAARAELARRGR